LGEMRNVYRSLVRNLKRRSHFGDLDVDGKTDVSNWILDKRADLVCPD
jgi:hypothetical protein